MSGAPAEASTAVLAVAEHPQALEPVGGRRRAAFEQPSLFDLEPPVSPAIAAPPELPVVEIAAGELRDPRQMAFSVVGRGAAIRLRSSFEGKRLTTALAVYDALTVLASEAAALGRGTPAEFRAGRSVVAAHAGVTLPTVDTYVRQFEEIGLLEVGRPRGGRDHKTNLWRLLSVDGDARGQANRTPSDFGRQPGDASNGVRGQANRTPDLKKKNTEEGNVIPLRDRSRRRESSHFDRALRR